MQQLHFSAVQSLTLYKCTVSAVQIVAKKREAERKAKLTPEQIAEEARIEAERKSKDEAEAAKRKAAQEARDAKRAARERAKAIAEEMEKQQLTFNF